MGSLEGPDAAGVGEAGPRGEAEAGGLALDVPEAYGLFQASRGHELLVRRDVHAGEAFTGGLVEQGRESGKLETLLVGNVGMGSMEGLGLDICLVIYLYLHVRHGIQGPQLQRHVI